MSENNMYNDSMGSTYRYTGIDSDKIEYRVTVLWLFELYVIDSYLINPIAI